MQQQLTPTEAALMTNTRKITGPSVLKASARFMEFKGHCRIPDTHIVAL